MEGSWDSKSGFWDLSWKFNRNPGFMAAAPVCVKLIYNEIIDRGGRPVNRYDLLENNGVKWDETN